LNVDACSIQCSKLSWQVAYRAWVDTSAISHAWHLDAAVVRQIRDEVGVAHVAIEQIRLIGLHSVDNA
jgi:hypothetical protein